MGAGQILYFILIPIKRQKPIAPAFPFKKAQELLVFDFYGPMTARNYENSPCHVNGFHNFFSYFFGGGRPAPNRPNPQGRERTRHRCGKRAAEGFSIAPELNGAANRTNLPPFDRPLE